MTSELRVSILRVVLMGRVSICSTARPLVSKTVRPRGQWTEGIDRGWRREDLYRDADAE